MKMPSIRRASSWKYNVAERGSNAVETLESAWQMLRIIEPRIPPAVLTFVDLRSRGHVRGYFAWSVWKKRRGAAHEIAISPKLIGSPKELLATMVHEAAHAILFESGDNGGIGSTPYYHTKIFRDQCIALGLNCEFWNSRYGWTLTSWPSKSVPERYKPIVACLRRELPKGTGGIQVVKTKGRSLPPTGHPVLVCKCDGGERTIFVKKSVLESGGINCSFCGAEFTPRNP